MTKYAIDLAREALRQRCGGGTEFHSDGAISIAYRFPSRQVADQFQNALAALTIEPVPPDREMMAKKLETATASYDEMREAAALLCQPAPAAIPSGIAGLIADIRAKGGLITCPDMLDFLNIVERALARHQPAPAEVEAAAVKLHDAEWNWRANGVVPPPNILADTVVLLRRLVLPVVGAGEISRARRRMGHCSSPDG